MFFIVGAGLFIIDAIQSIRGDLVFSEENSFSPVGDGGDFFCVEKKFGFMKGEGQFLKQRKSRFSYVDFATP